MGDKLAGRLRDRVILITGSTYGIGREMAAQFAREGARVAVTGRSAEKGEAAAEEIRRSGGSALFAQMDVADERQVVDALARVASHFGRLDGLVNNAALVQGTVRQFHQPGDPKPQASPLEPEPEQDGPVSEINLDNWERILRVNATGTFLVSKHAIPHMIRAGGGSIVNIASTAAMQGRPGLDAYTASKGAVVSLTRSMAYYYARYQIRVNCLVIGFVDTGQSAIRAMLADAKFNRMIRRYYLGRLGTPLDIAYSAAHLLSDEAAWTTASIVAVDGGATGVSHMERRVADVPGFPTHWNDALE
jgi:NAD(P)-dependent dehydrogenase (short-subunit alcohol dehydrogenase family)